MIEKGYYFEAPIEKPLAVTQLINPFDKQGEQAHEAYKQIAIDSAKPGEDRTVEINYEPVRDTLGNWWLVKRDLLVMSPSVNS